MFCKWSQEYPLIKVSILNNAPVSSGIYQIFQSIEYPRYIGKTRVLKIGSSKFDLQTELLNHLGRHTVSNRLVRIQNRSEMQIFFRYKIMDPENSILAEKKDLRKFEDEHWDLPVLNSQRGYNRGEDIHYKH